MKYILILMLFLTSCDDTTTTTIVQNTTNAEPVWEIEDTFKLNNHTFLDMIGPYIDTRTPVHSPDCKYCDGPASPLRAYQIDIVDGVYNLYDGDRLVGEVQMTGTSPLDSLIYKDNE